MELTEAIAIAERKSGLKELDYNPSSSDATCWHDDPISVGGGYSYSVFRWLDDNEPFGIRTAEDADKSKWKWIDP